MAFIDWATHVYIDDRQKKQWCELSKTQKDILVELFFATQEHEAESLVMWIITYGELVTESSTYRPYAMEIILGRSCFVKVLTLWFLLRCNKLLSISLSLHTISF